MTAITPANKEAIALTETRGTVRGFASNDARADGIAVLSGSGHRHLAHTPPVLSPNLGAPLESVPQPKAGDECGSILAGLRRGFIVSALRNRVAFFEGGGFCGGRASGLSHGLMMGFRHAARMVRVELSIAARRSGL